MGCSQATARPTGAGSFNVSQAPTTPGGPSNATVPLGLIAVQALHLTGTSIGLPYAGTTFQLTATTAGCSGDTYTLRSCYAISLGDKGVEPIVWVFQ